MTHLNWNQSLFDLGLKVLGSVVPMHFLKNSLLVTTSILMSLAMPLSAEAKIGEPIAKFQKRFESLLKLRTKSKKDDVENYQYALVSEESERNADPGFGAGLTISVKDGLIVSQSMAFIMGKDRFLGGQLASSYGLKFALDAIGRTMPGDTFLEHRELEIFNKAASTALAGLSQEIRYPGYEGQIILSRGPEGNLLVAIVKEETKQSKKEPDKPGGMSSPNNTAIPPSKVTGVLPSTLPGGARKGEPKFPKTSKPSDSGSTTAVKPGGVNLPGKPVSTTPSGTAAVNSPPRGSAPPPSPNPGSQIAGPEQARAIPAYPPGYPPQQGVPQTWPGYPPQPAAPPVVPAYQSPSWSGYYPPQQAPAYQPPQVMPWYPSQTPGYYPQAINQQPFAPYQANPGAFQQPPGTFLPAPGQPYDYQQVRPPDAGPEAPTEPGSSSEDEIKPPVFEPPPPGTTAPESSEPAKEQKIEAKDPSSQETKKKTAEPVPSDPTP